MDTPVSLDLALRQHQATLRVLEDLLYSREQWEVVVGDDSFPASISIAPNADGVRISALVNRPCSGTVVVRQCFGKGSSVLVHPEQWSHPGPSRLEWDVVFSRSLAVA